MMAGKLQIVTRTVREVKEGESFAAFSDPLNLLRFDGCKARAYERNPYLPNGDTICQLFGVKDSVIVGRRNSFPARFVADGIVYNCRISGSVYVDLGSRSSLLGITLLSKALKLPDGELNINCGLSPVNRKFYKLAGASMFRMVNFDVGGRWNKFYKGTHFKGWRRFAAWGVSVIITTFNFLNEGLLGWWKFRGLPVWSVREISPFDSGFLRRSCDLVKTDCHKYREEITPDWIRWTLTNDFHSATCSAKQMFGVYDRDRFVGFALTRSSSEWMRKKIYEWQLDPAYEEFEAEFLSLIARQLVTLGSSVSIMVSCDQTETIKKLASRFAMAGDDYAVVTIRSDSKFKSFEGICAQQNWRVRPGMGDACLW